MVCPSPPPPLPALPFKATQLWMRERAHTPGAAEEEAWVLRAEEMAQAEEELRDRMREDAAERKQLVERMQVPMPLRH